MIMNPIKKKRGKEANPTERANLKDKKLTEPLRNSILWALESVNKIIEEEENSRKKKIKNNPGKGDRSGALFIPGLAGRGLSENSSSLPV